MEKAISEAALQTAILEMARRLGWLAYHTHDSRASEAGFPDLLLLRPNPHARVIVAELKAEGKHPTPAQEEWLDTWADLALSLGASVALDERHNWRQGERVGVGPARLRWARGGPVEVYVWRPSDWTAGDVEKILR